MSNLWIALMFIFTFSLSAHAQSNSHSTSKEDDFWNNWDDSVQAQIDREHKVISKEEKAERKRISEEGERLRREQRAAQMELNRLENERKRRIAVEKHAKQIAILDGISRGLNIVNDQLAQQERNRQWEADRSRREEIAESLRRSNAAIEANERDRARTDRQRARAEARRSNRSSTTSSGLSIRSTNLDVAHARRQRESDRRLRDAQIEQDRVSREAADRRRERERLAEQERSERLRKQQEADEAACAGRGGVRGYKPGDAVVVEHVRCNDD